MPDGAGMFSRQIPAYAGYLRVTKYSPLYTKNKEYDTTAEYQEKSGPEFGTFKIKC